MLAEGEDPAAGVDGWEGMGGRDSRSAAPNEDDGLNGLSPVKPVVCLCNGPLLPAPEIEIDGAPPAELFVVAVNPVGCEESAEKRESENVEPVVVLDVGCDASAEKLPEPGLWLWFCVPPGFDESNAKDDAMLAMTDDPLGFAPFAFGPAPGPELPFCPCGWEEFDVPNAPKLGNAPVCMGCCCCC